MDEVHSCSYYCERPACVRAQRDELREVLSPALECLCMDGFPQKMWVITHGDWNVATCPACLNSVRWANVHANADPVVVRTTTVGTSDKPIEVWVGTAEPPAVLPKGPSCCCTDPPTKMGLTFYMDSTVGPVQRVDAACPACGAMVKGLKL